MIIRDSQYVKAMKEHMEACSKITNSNNDAPTSDQFLVRDASGEESAINLEGEKT